MSKNFKDKHVVVTGGTGALGTTVCQLLVDRGAHCHVPTRRAFAPEGYALADHDRVTVATGIDLADETAVSSFYGQLPSLWASIHLAGGFATAPVVDTTLAQFQHMLTTNTVACFLACREAIRKLRECGGGRIVNVAARPAVDPVANMTAYIASKAAVAAMTRGLAAELVGDGICVNAILPSVIDTPANRASMPDADHSSWPTPTELAEAVAYPASPASAATSGALVPVYGRA